jgi:hypothetical protein
VRLKSRTEEREVALADLYDNNGMNYDQHVICCSRFASAETVMGESPKVKILKRIAPGLIPSTMF